MSAESETQQVDPAVAQKIAELRAQVRDSFGKVVMGMMGTPRYRHQSVADLQHLILEPLIRDRVAFAYRGKEEGADTEDMAGVAIWASVSQEVDIKIREQIKAGVWPVRMKPEDWASGEINWLLDILAADKKATLAVLRNFKQVIKEGDLRLHPVVATLLDEDALKKLRAAQTSATTGEKPTIN